MPRKYPYYYKRHNLKHVVAFITPEDLLKLKRLAADDDKSITRYVTRLLERHIRHIWQQQSEDIPARRTRE